MIPDLVPSNYFHMLGLIKDELHSQHFPDNAIFTTAKRYVNIADADFMRREYKLLFIAGKNEWQLVVFIW